MLDAAKAPVRFCCPGCGAGLRASRADAGTAVSCHVCGEAVRVPRRPHPRECDLDDASLVPPAAALDARRRHTRPLCVVGGGETTVTLGPDDRPRKGGRNQEIALAAIDRFWDEPADGVVVLSGGTDGEDGPTDAAGAIADVTVIAEARRRRLSDDGPVMPR